tara:strand:- start:856 stop:1221 length:366 start_codon:yes stop_codon:yes gene_type:complete
MQIQEFVDCLRIRANFIRTPEGSLKGQDAFLMDKAAEVIERTFRVLERESSQVKPGVELLSQIHREIDAETQVPPANDFKTPEIPGYRKNFELNKREALVENDTERVTEDACVDATRSVAI